MRVLTAIFIVFASIASAAPKCAEAPDPYLPVSDRPELPEEFETLPTDTTTESAPAIKKAVLESPRPELRPCKFRMIALGRERMQKRGALCNDWTIVGEALKPFAGKYRGCGIGEPVRVYMISDVHLSRSAMMDCKTAVTLKTWIENTAKPAFADQGGLEEVRILGSYSCRTQNNHPRAQLSEHAKGRAIDISGFRLKNGTLVSILDSWGSAAFGEVMARLHDGACGLFGTVLGPGGDKYHKNHFHFDTAVHRKGPLCR
ncbi:MAG: extensin-like domain-containing protein [Ruegeria sp.]